MAVSVNQPLTVERIYYAPAHKIWQALTHADEMRKWYFDLAEFRPVAGFKFELEGGTDEHTYLHKCHVTEVVPDKKLSHTWCYNGYPGESLLTFELTEKESQTSLKLTHSGLETFPNNPDFARSNFEAGWDHIINVSLKKYLED